MTKRPKPAPVESEDVAALTKVVQELKVQVRELARIMDEVREDLLGAVRNNQLDPCATRRMVDGYLEDEEVAAESEADEEPSPVPPPPVRPTGSPQRPQRTLFS
jgi:hypothetical protein